MKNYILLIIALIFVSCDQTQSNAGVIQNDDSKSEVVVKLADSYLAGNFDMAREYFSTDSKHYFNDLEFDVDGIIEGYNSHSLIFNDIKHNDRKVYTGYLVMDLFRLFMTLIGQRTSIISGKEYYYPAHCRWVWEGEQIVKTNCYVDPAAIFAEVALYQETNQ